MTPTYPAVLHFTVNSVIFCKYLKKMSLKQDTL